MYLPRKLVTCKITQLIGHSGFSAANCVRSEENILVVTIITTTVKTTKSAISYSVTHSLRVPIETTLRVQMYNTNKTIKNHYELNKKKTLF